jgi:hypothetical protein
LVKTNAGYRIVMIDANSSRVEVPVIPDGATWFKPADAVQGWVWGDGSRMVVRGIQGIRTVQVAENENIGVAQIEGSRAIAITHTATNSAVIVVDLTTALVRTHEMLGTYEYSQFVLCRDRVVASSGRALHSGVIGGDR